MGIRRAFVRFCKVPLGVVATFSLLAGCGSGASSAESTLAVTVAPITTATVKLSVAIIGDSMTAQSKAKLSLDEYDLYIYAVSGITIAEQLPVLTDTIAREPHVLVVQLGGNDLGRWGPANVAEVLEILDAATAIDCVRWVNLVNPNSNASEVNALLADQVTARPNFAIIDWAEAVGEHPTWLGPDGIHPSEDEGQLGFASIVEESVRACPA